MKKDLSFNESCLQESVFSSTSDVKVEVGVEYPAGYMYFADDPECSGLLPVQDPGEVVGWRAEEQISESEVMTQQTIIDLTLEVFRKYPLIKRIL